jgi:N-acyl-D-aspartate/D-glutamate deacylase
MSNPDFKRQLLTEKSEPLAGDGSAVPPLADKLLENIDFVAMRLFRIGENPNYEPGFAGQSIFAEAQRRGVSPLEAIYDALLEDEGPQLLYFPIYNYSELLPR